MLRAFRLLLIVSVLWCGMHVEPVEAHGRAAHAQAELNGHDAPDSGDEHKGRGDAAHMAHHHCPMAQAYGGDAPNEEAPGSDTLLFAAPALPLGSLTQAPPLEPPSA